MSLTTTYITENFGANVVERLQETLIYVARPSLDPPIERHLLRFQNVAITPTVLALIVKLLHHSLPNSDTHNGGKESLRMLITLNVADFGNHRYDRGKQPLRQKSLLSVPVLQTSYRPCILHWSNELGIYR